MLYFELMFIVSFILIFHTMIGYPVSLKILYAMMPKKRINRDLTLEFSVSIIIPAHNEEKVIRRKLENLISLNYPQDLTEIIIASDNSTDKTDQIVNDFCKENPEANIKLHVVKKRMGKTNAQNEAVETSAGEILIFSDANALLDKDSIRHLVSSFTSKEIIYVTGRLIYTNALETICAESENSYWNYEIFMRKAESDLKTITAGNGAIYAIRRSEYVSFKPTVCHDGMMPEYAALNNKKALFNEKAVAYEKAGETSGDEFKRKVRMFRDGIKPLFRDMKKYNPFIYGWFSYFYFFHRACRRTLFILHLVMFFSNLALLGTGIIYNYMFAVQCLFILLAVIKNITGSKSRFMHYPYYYLMTLTAQLLGTYNSMTGRSKPFWEKAESTR